jgi:hypothetical protein
MVSVSGTLGLYNGSQPLAVTGVQAEVETGAYSAGWTVPFAAKAYFEKMVCGEPRGGDGASLLLMSECCRWRALEVMEGGWCR